MSALNIDFNFHPISYTANDEHQRGAVLMESWKSDFITKTTDDTKAFKRRLNEDCEAIKDQPNHEWEVSTFRIY